MKNTVQPIYKEYPEQPYISPERDLEEWAQFPERFPYSRVEKSKMQRLPEGILPGHIVMLWRVHFGTFTNESIIPQYFEYRYGIESGEALQTLQRLGYIRMATAKESLEMLNLQALGKICRANGLDAKGKKADIVKRLRENISDERLEDEFNLRKYEITEAGAHVLAKYDDIIQKHGPKG